jgi:hypothetical protein
LVPLEMSTIDIEAPGASEAALKAAIQALIPISTTTISSPVNYVDIDLPSGYSAYKLFGSHVRWTGDVANFMAAFSSDGGTTWIETYNTDWDSYKISLSFRSGAAFSSLTTPSGVLELSGNAAAASFELVISPGSASIRPALHGILFNHGVTGFDGTSYLHAVCTDAVARVDAFRFAPFGNSAISTPDVGATLSAGATFTLYGVL